MSVILIVVGLVFGAYLYQPMWFDNGPYHYVSSHESLADCQKAKRGHEVHMQDGVCYGESPSKLYVKDGEEVGLPYPPVEPYVVDVNGERRSDGI